jgi:ribose 5-phosphate isomerase A
MVVGLGTGSTACFAIRKLGERVARGLSIRGVPTSRQSAELAETAGIPLTDLSAVDRIDLTIDGADEVDPAFCLIKGGGGALLREKIVASASQTEIVVVDASKVKDCLGSFPLPVEVTPFGWPSVSRRLAALGCVPVLRGAGGEPFVTDNGNYILDCPFGRIDAPGDLENRILHIPGVVECGLFVGLVHRVLIGRDDGTCQEWTEPRAKRNARPEDR